MHFAGRCLFEPTVSDDAESSPDDLLWRGNHLELSDSGVGYSKRLFPLDANVVFLVSHVVQHSDELGGRDSGFQGTVSNDFVFCCSIGGSTLFQFQAADHNPHADIRHTQFPYTFYGHAFIFRVDLPLFPVR